MDAVAELGFEERLGLLLDREQAVRETRWVHTWLRKAKLRQNGVLEDIDFRHRAASTNPWCCGLPTVGGSKNTTT